MPSVFVMRTVLLGTGMSDNFNRANSTTTLGTPSDRGTAWAYYDLQYASGNASLITPVMGITSNTAYALALARATNFVDTTAQTAAGNVLRVAQVGTGRQWGQIRGKVNNNTSPRIVMQFYYDNGGTLASGVIAEVGYDSANCYLRIRRNGTVISTTTLGTYAAFINLDIDLEGAYDPTAGTAYAKILNTSAAGTTVNATGIAALSAVDRSRIYYGTSNANSSTFTSLTATGEAPGIHTGTFKDSGSRTADISLTSAYTTKSRVGLHVAADPVSGEGYVYTPWMTQSTICRFNSRTFVFTALGDGSGASKSGAPATGTVLRLTYDGTATLKVYWGAVLKETIVDAAPLSLAAGTWVGFGAAEENDTTGETWDDFSSVYGTHPL